MIEQLIGWIVVAGSRVYLENLIHDVDDGGEWWRLYRQRERLRRQLWSAAGYPLPLPSEGA